MSDSGQPAENTKQEQSTKTIPPLRWTFLKTFQRSFTVALTKKENANNQIVHFYIIIFIHHYAIFFCVGLPPTEHQISVRRRHNSLKSVQVYSYINVPQISMVKIKWEGDSYHRESDVRIQARTLQDCVTLLSFPSPSSHTLTLLPIDKLELRDFF